LDFSSLHLLLPYRLHHHFQMLCQVVVLPLHLDYPDVVAICLCTSLVVCDSSNVMNMTSSGARQVSLTLNEIELVNGSECESVDDKPLGGLLALFAVEESDPSLVVSDIVLLRCHRTPLSLYCLALFDDLLPPVADLCGRIDQAPRTGELRLSWAEESARTCGVEGRC
jgi:hypothetical protein